MDAFYERLIVRAATVDEVLSEDFELLPGQKRDAEIAGRRLSAWCRSCASGDWSLFGQRLARDSLAFAQVLAKFARVRRRASAAPPAWIGDAMWIEAALRSPCRGSESVALDGAEPCPFEHLHWPLVEQAETRLHAALDPGALANLSESARTGLRHSLRTALSELSAPALYERFAGGRRAVDTPRAAGERRQQAGRAHYDHFVAEMRAGGLRQLFEDKPVLLRLMATLVRQWIDTSCELLARLSTDLAAIRREISQTGAIGPVVRIDADLSDRHNGGRSVHVVAFADGSRVVYKPKDLRLDAAWHAVVERLNRADPPLLLKAVRALPRDGYGWSEFIDHVGCANGDGWRLFFRRAGAWLALFHCFAATDMHQENIIAAGDHPVPIDLEMILQAGAAERNEQDPHEAAVDAARQLLANSVMAVGLLPSYGRSPDNNIFAVGGLTADWDFKAKIKWNNINSDAMRPAIAKQLGRSNPNLPHVEGQYAKFAEYSGDFIAGFEDYAKFLLYVKKGAYGGGLFDGFAGLPVRKVIRPTRFYQMLLQRLRNHRTMDDGVVWSAQADFLARLADWETDCDPLWPLQRAERAALLSLNVPHFVTSSDGGEIWQATDSSIENDSVAGIDVARTRLEGIEAGEIAWQVEVIRQNANCIVPAAPPVAMELPCSRALHADAPATEIFRAEADRIAEELCRYAIRRGPGAAWIGLDWLGDAEVFQLVCLGPDLYNGASGIALFLAAHAAAAGSSSSAKLAIAAVAYLRRNLSSRNAARFARSCGVGGAVGLGSIVYALTVMAKCLRDDDLLADAQRAAQLFTDELIEADRQLDVLGGSAGGILGLLRLYRDTLSADVLKRATKCGEYLLAQPRLGGEGRRSWIGQGLGSRALNGMSHGAAGFAYALASLAAATGREDFAQAAAECIAFEDSCYDAERNNWPDRRGGGEPAWPCRWCHGAVGIGLARIAMRKLGAGSARVLASDIGNALAGVERNSTNNLDTLCCGMLGNIEFLYEVGGALGRGDIGQLASRRLIAILQQAASTGDFRWNSGNRQFNLGFFRGLAGVGYTLLRRLDGALPNVLIWE